MQQSNTFVIGNQDFELNGEPIQIRAGSIHYSRVHPSQWEDRIRKARQMGLNTIETYVIWNFHSPEEGVYDWEGWRDLGAFLDLVKAEGMWAIVRPGPYACAEWDNGGLPVWLTSKPDVTIRTSNPTYMRAVEEYMREVGEIVAPRQVDQGGPVILMQVENEYGAYGNDKDYLRSLVDLYHSVGITVPLTTVDQPVDYMLENGTLPGLHTTGSFGGKVPERLAVLRKHQKTGPLMCAEFWIGWFDHWGARHHTTSVEEATESLRHLLEAGASFTIYMFHGGTSFGLTSGANDKGIYQPTITSYDYDAPLSEDGTPGPKYWAFKEMIGRYHEVPEDGPENRADAPTPTVELSHWASLLEVAETAQLETQYSASPTSFEDFPRQDGLLLYTAPLQTEYPEVLESPDLKDRAHLFVDGHQAGTMVRSLHDTRKTLPPIAKELQILVENEGRVNYGPRLGEKTGLGPTTLAGNKIDDWKTRFIPLRSEFLQEVATQPVDSAQPLAGPLVARGTFDCDQPGTNLFLDASNLSRGFAFVNGFFLGRYSAARPQRTLYVPGPIIKETGNEIVLVEMSGLAGPQVKFAAKPDLGPTEE